MSEYLIQGETLSAIADKIREYVPQITTELTPTEMADNIAEVYNQGYEVGQSGGATRGSYYADRVEDLPSDVPEYSTGIVRSDSTIGTYRWNSTLNFGDFILEGTWSILVDVLVYDPFLGFSNDGLIFRYEDGILTLEYNDGTAICIDGEWDDAYEDFIIYTGVRDIYSSYPDEFTEETFKIWLYSNTTRLSGGESLYVRENGEWVYKCEIAQ